MLMLLRTSLGLQQIAAWLTVSVGIILIILQFFGMFSGVTVLVVSTEEFEPFVIFSSDDSDLRSTFAAITHQVFITLIHSLVREL